MFKHTRTLTLTVLLFLGYHFSSYTLQTLSPLRPVVGMVECVTSNPNSTSLASFSHIHTPAPDGIARVEPHRTSSSTLGLLELPAGTSSVIFNVGSNIDPILPKIKDGPCAFSIAFEPLAHASIEPHPQLLSVPAAVSSASGLATMYDYGAHSVSSSLAKARGPSFWNYGLQGDHGSGQTKLVPVLKFSDILQAIPPHIPILFVKTDVQSHDFEVISSAIHVLVERKVPLLRTEVMLDQTMRYQNASNDLCVHWLPFMNKHGYMLDHLDPPRKGWNTPGIIARRCQKQIRKFDGYTYGKRLKELDALWRLASVYPQNKSVEDYTYPVIVPNTSDPHYTRLQKEQEPFLPKFARLDYAKCNESNSVSAS